MVPRRCVVFASSLLAFAPWAPAQVSLRYRLDPGATFHYRLTIDATVKQSRGNQHVEFGMHFVLHFTATPGERRGDQVAVPHLLTRIEAKSAAPLVVDYDSDVKDSQAGSLGNLAALVGKTFVVPVDDRGRIGKIEAPAGVDAQATDKLGAGDLDTLFGQYFIALPAEPVAEGGTWESEVKLLDPKLTGGKDVVVTNKLLRVEGSKAVIERKFLIDASQAPAAAGMTVKVEKSEGTVILDVASGRLVGGVMQLGVSASGQGQAASSDVRVMAEPEAAPAPRTENAAPAAKDR